MPSITINYKTITFNNIYYVDTVNGNDTTGDGSEQNPYKTLPKAISIALDGDAIYLKNKYVIESAITLNKNISIIGNYIKHNSEIENNLDLGNYGRFFKTTENKTQKFYNLKITQNYTSYGEIFDGFQGTYTYKGYIELYNCVIISRASRPIQLFLQQFNVNNCLLDVNDTGFVDASNRDYTANTNYLNTACTIAIERTANSTKTSCLESVTYDFEYNITSDGWIDAGTGTDPDGSIANIGVYGGPYAWGDWFFHLIKSQDKIYTYNNGWVDLQILNPTQQDFETYGISDLTPVITPTPEGVKPIYLLNNPRLLTYSKSGEQLKVNLNVVTEKRTRFLVSKDGCLTWYAFKDGIWKQVTLTDINDKGMSKTELQAITSDQWKQWFIRGTLDFAVSLKTTNPYSSPTLNKITVNFPANQAPLIQNPSLTPDTIHNEWVELRATVEDLEGDQFQYQVWINGSQVYPTTVGEWSPLLNSGESIFKAYNYPYFRVGTNVVKLIVRDRRGLTREWSGNVTVTNINPTITVSHGNFSLVGTIGDDNSDSVAYRILINGRQVFPTEGNNVIDGILYSDFAPPPRQIKYEWGSNDVRFGVPNTFIIEVIDNFKGKGSAEFQVVGTYKGILFMDEQGNFYSTDKGEILKYLDFGTLIAGQETEPQLVYLKNQNGFDVENVELRVTDNLPPGVSVYISKSNQPFEYNVVIEHPSILQDEESIPFYVKLVTDKIAEAGVSFEITTKATPVI